MVSRDCLMGGHGNRDGDNHCRGDHELQDNTRHSSEKRSPTRAQCFLPAAADVQLVGYDDEKRADKSARDRTKRTHDQRCWPADQDGPKQSAEKRQPDRSARRSVTLRSERGQPVVGGFRDYRQQTQKNEKPNSNRAVEIGNQRVHENRSQDNEGAGKTKRYGQEADEHAEKQKDQHNTLI
jgi:hypothetical protein